MIAITWLGPRPADPDGMPVRAGSVWISLAGAAALIASGCAQPRPERRVPAPPVRRDAQATAPPARVEPAPAAPAPGLAWPVHGRLASAFGVRGRGRHEGIDILAPLGTPVVAAAEGRVRFGGWMRGYGYVVFVEHEGKRETRYAHLRRIHVRRGQWVAQGARLGEVGRSGNATTPHLHFEVRERQRATDPLPVLAGPDSAPQPSYPASLP